MNNAGKPNADPATLIYDWQVGIRIIHLAHTRAAADFAWWGRFLGLGVAIITAITGSAVFAAADNSNNRLTLLIVGGFIILAAVVGAIQTTLQFPALAAEHAAAAKEYGVLRKEFETRLLCGNPENLCELLHEIRAKWTEIEGKYRFVSDKRYASARKYVHEAIDKERELRTRQNPAPLQGV